MIGNRLSDALNIAKALIEHGNTIEHVPSIASILVQPIHSAMDTEAPTIHVTYRSLTF